MSDQRKRTFEKASDENNGDGKDEEDPPVASTSKQTEDAPRYSNVRCSRSVLERETPPPLPPTRSTSPEETKILEYLDHNKDFLDSYVLQNVPLEKLEGWIVKKIANGSVARETSTLLKSSAINNYTEMYSRKDIFMTLIPLAGKFILERTKGNATAAYDGMQIRLSTEIDYFTDTFNHQAGMKEHLCFSRSDLLKKFQGVTNEKSVLWELASFICTSLGVTAYRVYKLFPDHPNYIQYFEKNKDKGSITMVRAKMDRVRNVIEVAKKGACLRLTKDADSAIFPEVPQSLLASVGLHNLKEANHVLYLPILAPNGKTVYVIEMFRIVQRFSEKDEHISSNFLVWGSLILHYSNLYLDKKRERNLTDFLLDVVKSIFEEMVSLDQLIKRILQFAQRLVNADRASLFLVDYRNFELVSTVFDLKFEPGQDREMEKKEIRMPINRGIAGFVALSGETMNIPDAYSDYRFNREVDEATGYKTVSILCMPVKVQGKVIGVVQMVNKRQSDNFDRTDEVAFEIFATFFGLALHHARLYDKIIRKEQKYRVALEVLSYHNTCKEHEVKAILTDQKELTVNIDDFYLDPYKLDDFEKCKATINMFDDLFDMSKFDILTLTRFILTVKKNYRTVPYHNFDHGWSVAHAMYVILKNDTRKRFDYKMRLSLFVASLCHDLDHRGYTNKYMSETASPLAAMYTTSTLEHHHFNITVTILQQDGHNIFSHFSSEEYKDILGYIRQCILATDLAVFFPNLEKLNQIFEGKTKHPKFNWAVPVHRDLAMAVAMTAADLSASAKPWEIQIKTVKVIFEEFYDQGDRERAAGKTPIPMMDRDKPDQQPSSQVGFLSSICVPCYAMLYKILPNTKPMYVMALRNLYNWKYKAAQIEKKLGAGSSSGKVDDVSDSELNNSELSEQVLLELENIPAKNDEHKGTEENGQRFLNEEIEEKKVIEEEGSKIQASADIPAKNDEYKGTEENGQRFSNEEIEEEKVIEEVSSKIQAAADIPAKNDEHKETEENGQRFSNEEIEGEKVIEEVSSKIQAAADIPAKNDEHKGTEENGQRFSNEEIEEEKVIEAVSSKIQAALQDFKSNSVSWDEDSTKQGDDSLKEDDEEVVVAKPHKTVEIIDKKQTE